MNSSAVETIILTIHGLQFPDHYALVNAIGQLNSSSSKDEKQLVGSKYALYMQAGLNGEVLATDPIPLTMKAGSVIDPSFRFNTQLEFMVSKQAFKFLKSTRAMIKLSCFIIGINSSSAPANNGPNSKTSQVERFLIGFVMLDLRSFTPSERRQSYKLYSNGTSLFPAANSKSQDILVDLATSLITGDVIAVHNEKALMSLPPSPYPANVRPILHSPAPVKPVVQKDSSNVIFDEDMMLAIFSIDDSIEAADDNIYKFRLVIKGDAFESDEFVIAGDSGEQQIFFPAGSCSEAELFLLSGQNAVVASEKLSLADYLKLGRKLSLGRHSFHLFCTRQEKTQEAENIEEKEEVVDTNSVVEQEHSTIADSEPADELEKSKPSKHSEVTEIATNTEELVNVDIRKTKEYKAHSLLEDWKTRCVHQFQQSLSDKENQLIDMRIQKKMDIANEYSITSKAKLKEVEVLETRVKSLLSKLDTYRSKIKTDLEDLNAHESIVESDYHKTNAEHENMTKRLHEEYKVKYRTAQNEYDKLRNQVTSTQADVTQLQKESKRLEEDAFNESVDRKNTDFEVELERDRLAEQVKSLKTERRRLTLNLQQESETQKTLLPKIAQQ